MTKKLLLIFGLLLFIKHFSQSEKLIGEWFLDRTVKSDGNNLEINNPKYSMFLTYKINPNELMINNIKFKAKFSVDQIKLDNRNFKYWFEKDYLLIQEGNEISLFLKADNFIKKYPEFEPKIEIRNNDSVIVANQIIHPIFNNEKTFDDFIIPLMTQESSKNMNDLYFNAEYILTKDNKITDIKIINKRTPQYDSQFIQALKKAEKYYENPYKKNLLVVEEKHFLKWYDDLKDNSEKELHNYIYEGSRFYDNNNFEKAIEKLSKIDQLNIKDNKFMMNIHDAYIKLGISYLALGKNDQACINFKKAGNLTDFAVRNYLKDFCK